MTARERITQGLIKMPIKLSPRISDGRYCLGALSFHPANKLPIYTTVEGSNLAATVTKRKTENYCDQPFVSETTRCVSNDFIQIDGNPGQNVVHFYV
jgi:hypothetical protein